MSLFKLILSAALLHFCMLQNVASHNLFETHYKTLIGNLEGESLEHIYDHMNVEELKENAESFSETCLNETDLESEYVIGNSSSVNSSELITLCPALLYRALVAEECGHDHADDEDEDEDKTTGYGYTWGFLSIFLISLAPILGLPLLMFKREKGWFNAVLQFLIGLGVSTMACDSLLHLWPESVGLADQEDGEDRTYLWRTVGMVGTLYVFFLFEALCHQVFRMKKAEGGYTVNSDGHGHGAVFSDTNLSALPGKEGSTENGYALSGKDEDEVEVKRWLGIPEDKLVITVILSACDFMCNFTDGLAIGTTFQDSSSSGISTSIAVACHEIPQEIGSFAILINYKIGLLPITLLNLLSIGGAFVGLFLGAGLSEYENFASWMTAFAAGSFLHIAFIDLLPQMMNVKTNRPWLIFFLQNVGLIMGFVIMLFIALYEDDINV